MDTQRTVKAWRLQWRSPSMSASSFWYYMDFDKACQAAGCMLYENKGYMVALTGPTVVKRTSCVDRED